MSRKARITSCGYLGFARQQVSAQGTLIVLPPDPQRALCVSLDPVRLTPDMTRYAAALPRCNRLKSLASSASTPSGIAAQPGAVHLPAANGEQLDELGGGFAGHRAWVRG